MQCFIRKPDMCPTGCGHAPGLIMNYVSGLKCTCDVIFMILKLVCKIFDTVERK